MKKIIAFLTSISFVVCFCATNVLAFEGKDSTTSDLSNSWQLIETVYSLDENRNIVTEKTYFLADTDYGMLSTLDAANGSGTYKKEKTINNANGCTLVYYVQATFKWTGSDVTVSNVTGNVSGYTSSWTLLKSEKASGKNAADTVAWATYSFELKSPLPLGNIWSGTARIEVTRTGGVSMSSNPELVE